MATEVQKSYLIVFNDEFAERGEVTDFINTIPEIINWQTNMPYCILAISSLSATEISSLLARINPDENGKPKGRYLVAEIGKNKQGWLPKSMWRMMNERHKPGE